MPRGFYCNHQKNPYMRIKHLRSCRARSITEGPVWVNERRSRNVSQAIRHGGQYRNGAPKIRARSRVLRAWRSEDVGLVRRARILRNYGHVYGIHAHSRTVRLPRDSRRVLRRFGVDRWIPHAYRRLRNRSQYGGRGRNGAQQQWVLYELERRTERRRVRISPAGVGHYYIP